MARTLPDPSAEADLSRALVLMRETLAQLETASSNLEEASRCFDAAARSSAVRKLEARVAQLEAALEELRILAVPQNKRAIVEALMLEQAAELGGGASSPGSLRRVELLMERLDVYTRAERAHELAADRARRADAQRKRDERDRADDALRARLSFPRHAFPGCDLPGALRAIEDVVQRATADLEKRYDEQNVRPDRRRLVDAVLVFPSQNAQLGRALHMTRLLGRTNAITIEAHEPHEREYGLPGEPGSGWSTGARFTVAAGAGVGLIGWLRHFSLSAETTARLERGAAPGKLLLVQERSGEIVVDEIERPAFDVTDVEASRRKAIAREEERAGRAG